MRFPLGSLINRARTSLRISSTGRRLDRRLALGLVPPALDDPHQFFEFRVLPVAREAAARLAAARLAAPPERGASTFIVNVSPPINPLGGAVTRSPEWGLSPAERGQRRAEAEADPMELEVRSAVGVELELDRALDELEVGRSSSRRPSRLF